VYGHAAWIVDLLSLRQNREVQGTVLSTSSWLLPGRISRSLTVLFLRFYLYVMCDMCCREGEVLSGGGLIAAQTSRRYLAPGATGKSCLSLHVRLLQEYVQPLTLHTLLHSGKSRCFILPAASGPVCAAHWKLMQQEVFTNHPLQAMNSLYCMPKVPGKIPKNQPPGQAPVPLQVHKIPLALLQVCRAPVRNRAPAGEVAVGGRITAVRVVAYG
jgi:hypothetical protein